MPFPQLVAEIDFTGNPTAGFYDLAQSMDGLVSYWRMDNATTLTDSEAVNTGTVVATPSLVTGALPNDSNQALSFNGTTQRAFVPSSGSLNPPSFSFSEWVKVSSIPGSTKDLAGKPGSWRFQINSAGKILFLLKNDTVTTTITSNTVIATGTYYHLTGTYDATANLMALYINGVLESSLTGPTGGYEVNGTCIHFAAAADATSPTWQSVTTLGGTSTTPNATAPASIAAGDLLISHIHMQDGSGVITAEPTGWILLGYAISPTNYWTRVYYKIATGSEPGSYTWTNSVSNTWLVAIQRVSGCDTTFPFANPCYGGDTGNSTTHSTGTHVPNVDNNLVMGLFSQRGGITWTEDAGTTERYDISSGVSAMAASTIAQVSAASINITGTASSGSTGAAFMLVMAGTGAASFTSVTEDEASMWSRALTAQEVASQYQSRLSGVGAWVDVSPDARAATTKISRQYELNRMEAGTAALTLKNAQRRYDPANASSTFYPNVKPNRKVRLRALLSGVYYSLFQGFVERWPIANLNLQSYDEISITAADGFKPLSRGAVTGDLVGGLSGTQINTVLSKAAWPVSDRAIDAGIFSMASQTFAVGDTGLTKIQEIADSELGIFYVAPNGQATFHDAAHRWTQTNSITSQATFSDTGAFIGYQDLVPSDDDDNTTSQWIVTAANGTTSTATDVVSASENFPLTSTRNTQLDNPADASTQALALLQITAKPQLRFDSLTLKLTAGTPSTIWVKALSLTISDRVTVIRTPAPQAGGSTITRDCFIEGITWAIAPDVWTVSWQLSPVATSSYYDTIVRSAPVSFWLFDTTT